MNNNINNNPGDKNENINKTEKEKNKMNEMNEKNEMNKKNEKKMADAEKKSALPIISVGITWLIFAVFFHITSVTKFFLVTVLSFIVYQIVKSKFPPEKVEIMMEPEKAPPKSEKKEPEKKVSELTPEERALKDLNERINLYFIEIKLLNDSIDDEFISNELYEIENTLKKIQVQLNDDALSSKAKKTEQLTQFFDYYMPTTIKILNSYKKIESQHLTGDNATETKKRVEESMPFIRKAFEKELDNMFSDTMIDITTDIDVLEAVLSKEGLMEKNTIGGMRDIQEDIKNDFFQE